MLKPNAKERMIMHHELVSTCKFQLSLAPLLRVSMLQVSYEASVTAISVSADLTFHVGSPLPVCDALLP